MKQSLFPLKMNLQFFAEGDPEPPTFTFADFKSFAESNEDAQKFLQSQTQSAADKQLEAWKQNNLETIKQDAIKQYENSKKNKTPEQLQLEKLQHDLEAEKTLRITNENKAFVAEQISGLKIDNDLKDAVSGFMLGNLVSKDTDYTKKAVESFTEVLSAIQEKHADALKNVEMQSAFGNKQQQSTVSHTEGDPMAALGQQLNQLL